MRESCIGAARRAHELAVGVQLDQAADPMAVAGAVVQGVHEARQGVAVWQAHEGVGVRVPAGVAETHGDRRIPGIAEVEEEGPTGVVVVGEQLAAFRHHVLGVVRVPRDLIGPDGGDQPAVAG